MNPRPETRFTLARLLFGADPKLHRMLQYWAATAALYVFFIFLFYDRVDAPAHAANGLALYTVCGIAAFYLLVRTHRRLGRGGSRSKAAMRAAGTGGLNR